MGSTSGGFRPGQPGDPNAPFDPTNVNDPRYDASRDPRYDPRWQKAQQRMWRDQARAQQHQDRAARRSQKAAWDAQMRAQRDQWRMYWRAQRRTSILGPLLLIAVGVVFFLMHTGRISPVGFWTWYGHWWPLLLIALGGLRLLEWAIDRARAPQGAPPMGYSVGAGVVLAVIALSLLGFATHVFQWHADRNGVQFFGFHGGDDMGHFFGEKHEEDAPQVTRAIAANAVLTIDSPRGDVTVSGTSDDGQLHLSAHKQAFTNSDDTANQRLHDLTPVLDGSNDDLRLRVPTVDGGSTDITVLVPATTRVTLNSNRGDVHVNNLKMPLTVTANNGDVEIGAITGAVQVHVNNRHHDLNVRSVTGDVAVEGTGDAVNLGDITGGARINGDFFGGGQIRRVSGAVQYHSSHTDLSFTRLDGQLEIDGNDLSAREVVGPLLVNTRSKNLTLERVTGDIRVTNSHGDVNVQVAPPTGTVTVDNQNGDVSVSMPSKARFTLSAESSDGDVRSDFGGGTSGGKGMLSDSVNGGGPQVRLTTSHGDVTVSRNDSSPLPPAPPPPPRITGSVGGSALPDTDAMQRDAMAIAANALRQSADAINATASNKDQAKQRAREAMEQAKQAMRDAQEKQKEAQRLARDASGR